MTKGPPTRQEIDTWMYAAHEWLDRLSLYAVKLSLNEVSSRKWNVGTVKRLLSDDRFSDHVPREVYNAVRECLTWNETQLKQGVYGPTTSRGFQRDDHVGAVSLALATDWHEEVINGLVETGCDLQAVLADIRRRLESQRSTSATLNGIDDSGLRALVTTFMRGFPVEQAADDVLALSLAMHLEPAMTPLYIYQVLGVGDDDDPSETVGAVRARDRSHAVHLLQKRWGGVPGGTDTVNVRLYQPYPPHTRHGVAYQPDTPTQHEVSIRVAEHKRLGV
jgi:hypothetical protein